MSKDPHPSPATDPNIPSKTHDDDVIVVPKGSSRAKFIMTALLVVLILTTFTVTGPVMDLLTGKSRAMNAYMSWKHPDGRLETMSASDFLLRKRSLSNVQSLLRGGRSQQEHDDGATASHILADELAKDAGVVVTDEEIAGRILAIFGTAEVYRRRLADYRMSTKEFEETLRSIFRVNRFEMLLAEGFSLPDPDRVVERWKSTHKERSIQTIEVPTERFAAEAEAACPAGPELEAWLESLSEAEKSTYRSQLEPMTSAEFVWFSLDPPTQLEKLLARYPRPASEDPEEVARTWYEANKDLLYKQADLPAGQPPSPDGYRPFDEVKENARYAGIAYQSMSDWWAEVKLKEAQGEPVSLATEAMGLGLAQRREDALRTAAQWPSASMHWKSQRPVEAMFQPSAEAGKLLPEIIVDPNGLFVGQLLQKQESRMPAFAEFEDKVRAGWIERKKGELAQAKLEELAAKFGTEPDPYAAGSTIYVEPDEAKFLAAAQELGLEVATQEWMDLAQRPKPGSLTPILQLVRRFGSRYGDTIGAISKPEVSPDRATAWLARNAGERDPDPERMTPSEYESASQGAAFESRQMFLMQTFLSDDFLKQQYALDLESWRENEGKGGRQPHE